MADAKGTHSGFEVSAGKALLTLDTTKAVTADECSTLISMIDGHLNATMYPVKGPAVRKRTITKQDASGLGAILTIRGFPGAGGAANRWLR